MMEQESMKNRLKIIREESIGNYSWDTSSSSINDGLWNKPVGRVWNIQWSRPYETS